MILPSRANYAQSQNIAYPPLPFAVSRLVAIYRDETCFRIESIKVPPNNQFSHQSLKQTNNQFSQLSSQSSNQPTNSPNYLVNPPNNQSLSMSSNQPTNSFEYLVNPPNNQPLSMVLWKYRLLHDELRPFSLEISNAIEERWEGSQYDCFILYDTTKDIHIEVNFSYTGELTATWNGHTYLIYRTNGGVLE